MKKIILGIFALLCAATLFYAGSKVYDQLLEYRKGTNTYDQMQEFMALPEPTTGASAEKRETERELAVQQEPEIRWPEVDFVSLKAVNPDIVGWLYCEGTVINYPVVQGSDNAYYLDHLVDGTYNGSGCLYVDYLVGEPFRDTHTVIYGHHMQNGTMFTPLDGYRQQEFFEEHSRMLLMTPSANYEVLLYAAYVVGTDENAWSVGFADDAEKEQWLQAAVSRSFFQSDVVPQASDPILTLSTCSYEFSNARLVVQGVLREHRPQQVPSTQPSALTTNPLA